MIKDRKQGHIGMATNNIEADARWYQEVLGFELIGDFKAPNGTPIKFLKNQDVVYEMYQPSEGLDNKVVGKIDHYCFESTDIEADYNYCKQVGHRITTDGIEEIPTLWDRGVRYFKIGSPTGKELEFCQIL